ncbi:MAG: hypothetical protein IID40_10245 [Planctomycetes bacterium]|nr:hypothetical protein [Planctomycetota bacterium]
MSDSPSPDSVPGDPIDGQQDLDALLEDISESAADLSNELGAGEPATSNRQAGPTVAAERQTPGSIEAQLDEIESLLESAGDDLGVVPSDAGESVKGITQPVESPEPVEVPASPGPEQAAPAHEPSAASPVGDAPGEPSALDTDLQDVGLGDAELPDLNDPSNPDPKPPDSTQPSKVAPSAAENADATQADHPDGLADGPGDDAAESNAAAARSGLAEIMRPVQQLPIKVLDGMLDLVDLIDRPFGWVEPQTRLLLGWAALATLFAAFIIFILGRYA